MIEIDPDTGCMLYVGGLILLLLITWLWSTQKAKKREIIKLTTIHVTCEYCSASYLVETFTQFHRCPTCNCVNKLTKK
jgi:hypothetical protein